jgi:cytochrome P450
LAGEAEVVIGAGTETTSWNLAFLFYHLLNTPSVLRTLKIELQNAIPDPANPPNLTVLEHLEYLSVVIRESLRLSRPVAGNAPRVCKEEI